VVTIQPTYSKKGWTLLFNEFASNKAKKENKTGLPDIKHLHL
jgi:hypothetical protein